MFSTQSIGGALVEMGEAMKRLAEVKDCLDIDVKQNFIDPFQTIVDKDLKDIQVENCNQTTISCTLKVYSLKGTSDAHFPQVVMIFSVVLKYLQHILVKIPQWLWKTTPFLPCQKQPYSQRTVSVHVSLNDNELLFTPPLSSVFCLFDGVLPSKTKLIHCILSIQHTTFWGAEIC